VASGGVVTIADRYTGSLVGLQVATATLQATRTLLELGLA